MNVRKINELISSSKMNKVQIAEKCQISRTTLDNLLSGADVKVSTIEALAKVLGVQVSEFFTDNKDIHVPQTLQTDNVINEELIRLRAENDLLRELAGLKKKSDAG